MSTTWTLLASEVCEDALEHCGVLDPDETATANQLQTALRGLDAVLKELPLVGYNWPKLSAETAMTWGGSGVQTISLPSDYYGSPVLWKTENGEKYPLDQITHADWVRMTNRTQEGPVTHFYISPARVLYMYPTPTDSDPGLYIQYQKIVDDASAAVTPDVLQIWKNALGYGVANEIGLKFQVPQQKRVEIAQRWEQKRNLALNSSIPSEVISFEVRE